MLNNIKCNSIIVLPDPEAPGVFLVVDLDKLNVVLVGDVINTLQLTDCSLTRPEMIKIHIYYCHNPSQTGS